MVPAVPNVGQPKSSETGDGGPKRARRVGPCAEEGGPLQLAIETLGLNLAEAKAILGDVQEFMTVRQVADALERRRKCPECGRRYHSKDSGTSTVHTLFGPVPVPNSRWNRCSCQTGGPKTFRPASAWLTGRASPELLYLETKWGSLIPFAKVADLLKEVLPVVSSTNHETVREHLQATAERMEQEMGEERQPHAFESRDDEADQPLPDGPMTVGIDGGYVRAAHKEGWFEVIAGRSVVPSDALRARKFRRPSASPSCRPTTRSHGGVYGS